jgi:hypothetical protein
MLGGQTPYGDTPDISSISDFDFYEPIWYYEEMSQFPEPKCYIQHKSGTPIVRSTVQAITEDQKMTDEMKKELQELAKPFKIRSAHLTLHIMIFQITFKLQLMQMKHKIQKMKMTIRDHSLSQWKKLCLKQMTMIQKPMYRGSNLVTQTRAIPPGNYHWS